MQMEIRMTLEPAFHGGGLVSAVVVHDQVDFHTRFPADSAINQVEEANEFLLAVAAVTAAEYFARGYVQRGKQSGGAMTDVVVRMAFRLTRLHRQQRLRAIQSLHLG